MDHSPRFNILSAEERVFYLKIREWRDAKLMSICGFLKQHHVTPDIVTYIGFLMMIPFVYFFSFNPWIALIFLLTNIFLDSLDGALARLQGVPSIKGEMLDTSIDYLSFFTVFLTFMYHGLVSPFWGAVYLLNYVIMMCLLIFINALKLKLFVVIKSRLLVYLFFIIWLITGNNYFDPLLVLGIVYMMITNIFLFHRLRCCL